MKCLIIYGTGEGQTRKIARFMENILEENDYRTSIADATEDPPSPDTFDMVIIGSSIHAHQYHPAVLDYIIKHAGVLSEKKSVFFSVCMAMASTIPEEHQEVYEITDEFLEKSGWKPDDIWYFAGALKYTQYDYFKRLVMRMIAKRQGGNTDTSKDHEYTDWDQVEEKIKTAIDS